MQPTIVENRDSRLERFFTFNTDLLCITDVNGNFNKMNPAWESMLGYTTEELEGKNIMKFVHPDDISAIVKAINDLKEHKQVLNITNRYRCNDDIYRYIEWQFQPYEDMIYVTGRDISTRKKLELEVDNSKRFLDSIVDAIPDVIFLKDRDSKYLGCNESFAKKVAKSDKKEVLGKGDFDYFNDLVANQHIIQDKEVMASRQCQFNYITIKTTNGIVDFETIKTPLYNENRDVIGMIGIARDVTERNKITTMMEEQRNFFQQTLNAIPDLIYYKDNEFKYLGCNKAFAEQYIGQDEDGIIGKTVRDFIKDEELAQFFHQKDKEVLDTGEIRTVEAKIKLVDNRIIDIETIKTPLLDGAGKVYGLIGISRDISTRKNNEEELRKVKDQLQEAQEFACLGYWELDVISEVYYWSDETFRIFGFKPQALIPTVTDFLKIIHPDDRDFMINVIKDPLNANKSDFDYRIIRQDKEIIWIHEKIKYGYDASGKLIHRHGVVQDITLRKLSEVKLKESEEKFKELAENLGEVIWVRQEGQLVYISPAYEKVWGRTCQSLYDNPDSFMDSIHPEDKERIAQMYFSENYTVKGLSDEQFRIIRPDGAIRWIWRKTFPINDKNGRMIRIVGISEDITRFKEYEESLRQAMEATERAKTTYQDMFHKSHAIMLLLEVESGKLINANNAACDFYGYTIEQLKTMNISEINPLKQPEIFQKMALAKTQKHPYFEFQHRLASGEVREVEVFASPLRVNEQLYLYSIINDITQRKTLEKAIKQANENFETFFNSINDLLYVVDFQTTKIMHVNSSVCEKLGYSKDEIIGKSVLLMHPENRRAEIKDFVMSLLSHDLEYCSIPVITKYGQEISVELRITAGEWNGEPVNFGVMKDISAITRSEEKFSKAFNSASAMMAITTLADGRYLNVNDTFLKTLGYTRSEVIGKSASDFNLYLEREQRAPEGMMHNLEVSLKAQDGSVYTCIYNAETITVGETPCLLKAFTDITQRKAIEDKLIKSEQKYKSLFNEMNDVFCHCSIICDELGKPIDYQFIAANHSVETMTGLKPEAIIGKTATEILPNFDQSVIGIFGEVALTGNAIHFDTFFKSLNKYYEVKAYSPSPKEFATLFSDITERVEIENNIHYLSYHDTLTGLYNRRFYEEELRRLDTERNLPISLIYGDVNGLKLINDAFGHLKGDELLQKAALAIRNTCRTDDIAARWGGDEFVLLLPNTKAEEAQVIVKRISEAYFMEQVNSIRGSISFGWDTKCSMSEDILTILKNAEDLMYKNKTHESERIRLNTIKTLMSTLHERYPGTEQQWKIVGDLCREIGRAIGLSELEVCRVSTAGIFHDIGNVSIKEGILNKSGKLIEQEWDEIKKHPETGYRILGSSNHMLELAGYILAHHERWDGTGYPKGLQGNDIPIESRIIALASSYVAMTSERPYRSALPKEVALQEILDNAGTQFDPEIVKVFQEKLLYAQLESPAFLGNLKFTAPFST